MRNPFERGRSACTHRNRPAHARTLLQAACLLTLCGHAGLAGATAIHVDTTEQKISDSGGCSLQEAIWAANLNDSKAIVVDADDTISMIDTECVLEDDGLAGFTIVLSGDETYSMWSVVDDPFNYMGPTATPIVLASIIIEANGAVIEHGANGIPFRAFAVGVRNFARDQDIGYLPGVGDLTLRNAYIRGFVIAGGDGSGGGGGGLGAGGAIYVHGGALTVESSTFQANGVYGGNGSRSVLNTGGGGGGGLSGNGGLAGDPEVDIGGGGGGGGGARGDGGEGQADCGVPCLGLGASGGGGGGTLDPGANGGTGSDESDGGFRCGGDGGKVDLNLLESRQSGEGGDCPGGGGGGGRDSLFFYDLFQEGGNGGEGNYGGGGGGGAHLMVNGEGGHGGFGGGGGGANGNSNALPLWPCSPDGGDGGFGGGGGAGAGGLACPIVYSGPGRAGSFAGNASVHDGGGGAGLGGAIFNHSGVVRVLNSTFTANSAARGVAGNWPNNEPTSHSGQDQGAAIFSVGGSLTVLNSTIYGNEGTSSNNGGAGIVVYAPGYDIYSPIPQVPPTHFELRNTIIAGNAAGSVVTKECRLIDSSGNSVVFEGSGNLIEDNDNCTEGHELSDDPLLESLQLNPPGLTPTMALGENSPAIDAADGSTALAYDQRGVARPVGLESDIGAFEWGAVVAKCKNVTVSADASCMADASVDDGSFAPGGGEVTLAQEPSGPYPAGATQVTLTATHESGEQDSCEATVTVVDSTPPVITATTAIAVMSPMRKHDLVNVGLEASATDNCGSAPASFQVAVFGDEDDETPTSADLTVFSPDATNLATATLRLRAERMDSADGRVYLVSVSGMDGAGNTGYGCATAVVPHNSSPGSLEQVSVQAQDALAWCAANGGSAPAAYYVIGDGPQIGPKPKK